MIIIKENEMQRLITLAEILYHTTTMIDIFQNAGLTIEDSNNKNEIGYHIYKILTETQDEIYSTLIEDEDLDIMDIQHEHINNAIIDMTDSIVTSHDISQENIIENYKNLFCVISKIIKTDIIIKPNTET